MAMGMGMGMGNGNGKWVWIGISMGSRLLKCLCQAYFHLWQSNRKIHFNFEKKNEMQSLRLGFTYTEPADSLSVLSLDCFAKFKYTTK